MNENILLLELDAIPAGISQTGKVVFDAEPESIIQDFNIKNLPVVLDLLSHDEYRSLFFLLLENYVELDCFPDIIKRDNDYLKKLFLYFRKVAPFDDNMLIDLFGTIKRFDILREFGTCRHFFENASHKIKNIWKLLYTLCEELTDADVILLKHRLFPCGNFGDLNSAEEVFCSAILNNKLSKTDMSRLKELFYDIPVCRNLVQSYSDDVSSAEYYQIKTPTAENHCGIAIIINHEIFYDGNHISQDLPERKGSNRDVADLQRVWRNFGFKTIVHKNKTDSEVLEIFDKLAKEDHTCYDAFVACYLSHGDKGIVYASNSIAIPIRSLIDIMANKCRTLHEKPKLFFIQACQGKQIQGLRCQTKQMSPCLNPPCQAACENDSLLQANIPAYADCFIMMSTIPGYVSFRSRTGGTWFVQTLVEVVECFGEDLTIDKLRQKVTNKVSEKSGSMMQFIKCKQTVITNTTLRRDLKLKKVK